MARRNQGAKLRWLAKRGVYYITWTEHGRSRERSTGTADREQAETIFAEWLHARGRGAGPSDPAEILVTDVLADYARERGPRVAAPRVIGCAIDALTGFWQGRTIADVTPQTCALYVEKRGRAANTMRRELNVLRTAINYAHRCGRITRPVAVELPDRPESRTRWLTGNEAARLLRASLRSPKVRLYLPLFILLGLYTGRRKEAILSLRWPQVDLGAGRIDFEIPGRKRNNKRRGEIRIPEKLLRHLKRARKRGTDLGYVLHVNGKRIGDIKKGFEAACARAGLEDVTAHVLKHTSITWSMQNGTPLWKAAGFYATTEQVIERIYGHHHPDYQREASENAGRRPRNVRVMR